MSGKSPALERRVALTAIARNRAWRRPALIALAPLIVQEVDHFSVDLIFAMRQFPATPNLKRSLIEVASDRVRLSMARTAALEILGESRFKMGGRFFVPMLQEDDPNIRFWACEALRWRGSEKHIQDITPLLEDNAEIADFGSVSECARRAIESIRLNDE